MNVKEIMSIMPDQEKANAEWYHRSATLRAQRTALSSKSDRSKLKRKPLQQGSISEESEEFFEKEQSKRNTRSKTKVDDVFRPYSKRKRDSGEED